MSALPPSSERTLRALLQRAAARAAERGTAVTAVHTQELAGPRPCFPALLSDAERRGEPRFAASRPERDLELLGLGAVRVARLHDAGALELAKATEGWLDPLLRSAPEGSAARGPFVFAGLAFEPRPAGRRERAWRPFGSAAAALPELALERCGARVYAHFTAVLQPVSAAERSAQVEAALQRLRGRFAGISTREPPAGRSIPHPPGDRAPDHPGPELREAIAEVRRGEAHKIVIARSEALCADAPIDVGATLSALERRHPRGLSFAYGIGRQTFLGCTPERLVRRAGRAIETGAVAATARAGVSRAEHEALGRALHASPKEREEHAWVVRGIEAVLRPLCSDLDIPAEPSPLASGDVQHLHTAIAGHLHSPVHVLALVAALHPTAAVAGAPREAALERIRRHERFDRGGYAGPIGWFDAHGDGDFFVALRCARVRGARARLYAGVGLVSGSDPEREWNETELKLETMREALRTR